MFRASSTAAPSRPPRGADYPHQVKTAFAAKLFYYTSTRKACRLLRHNLCSPLSRRQVGTCYRALE